MSKHELNAKTTSTIFQLQKARNEMENVSGDKNLIHREQENHSYTPIWHITRDWRGTK